MRSFFRELKQRRVYRVAIGYAVIAWLVIQISATVMPAYHAPDWILPIFITVIALGFPVALVLAWAFEVKDGAIELTDPHGDLSPANLRRVWLLGAVGLLVALIAVGIFWLWQGSRAPPRLASDTYSGSALAELSAREASAIPQKSVAVLPFENLSRDPDNAFFADGIQDEILTRLAKVADLKVISRTSTQHFKSSPDNLPLIAKQLGVTNILEGSVQKSADQVRVNVQLINALTDAHLWAETYDRHLSDIFKVETEIAKTVADTLEAKITHREERAVAAQPTSNPAAYELYLKGRYFWNKRNAEDLRKALHFFTQATQLDPSYALAYAGIADTYVIMPNYNAGSANECLPLAKAAVLKALQLDEGLAEAHASYGEVLCSNFDFAEATKQFERAIELNPNYATAHQWFGIDDLDDIGELDRGLAEVKRAHELDPMSLIIDTIVGVAYYNHREYDQAIEQFHNTLEIDPLFYEARLFLGQTLDLQNRFNEAIDNYKGALQASDDPSLLAGLAHAYARRGSRDEALKVLEQLKQLSTKRFVAAISFAFVYLALGDKEEALRWLEKGYDDRSIAQIKVEPFLDPLRGDPRFERLVSRVTSDKKNSPQSPASKP